VNIKTVLKSSVAATALFAFATPMSTTAMAADDTFSSGQKTKLVMSGYVGRAIWHADDGTSDKTFQSGMPASPSRIRWVASGTLNDNITAGATMELSMPESQTEGSATLNGAVDPTVGGVDGADNAAWGIRHEYVWVNHKKFGKLSLGQTAVASASRGEISANGTDYSRSGRNYGRGITFVNTTAAANAVSTNTVGAVFGDLDVSRTDVLRYDTPTFLGARASIARHHDSDVSVGLNYGGKFGGFAVAAGAGYINQNGSSTSSNFIAMGSISVLHDSGLNVSYQTGKQNFSGPQSKSNQASSLSATVVDVAEDANNLGGRDDPYFHGVQLGYRAAKLVGVGGTNFALTWQSTQNLKENDGDATSWSIRVQQAFTSLGATMALSYQRYSYDSEGEVTVGTKINEDYDDIDVIALATTFNF